MFYAFQDASQRALSPLSFWAGLGAAVSQLNPLMPSSLRNGADAGFSLVERLTKVYGKPEFNISEAVTDDGVVDVEESVALAKPFCELRHFAKHMDSPGPRLLVVAPLSGHHATLLRETVVAMLGKHDVYITDWADARCVPLSKGKFDLSDYAAYVQEFVRFLGQDGQAVHVLAVCQPCVPTLAALGLMEQNHEPVIARSLTLIAGPVDVTKSPTEVDRFATEHSLNWFEHNVIEYVPLGYPGTGRKVYPGYLQLTGFVMMNKARHEQAYRDYVAAKSRGDQVSAHRHEDFYDEYNAVLDMPAEYYLETIQKVFLEPQLARGKLELCGQLVDVTAVRRLALLTIEGGKDDITGAGQTHATHELCSSLPSKSRGQLTIEGVGHYGAFSGSKFRAQAVPVINKFVARHG
jgi:poly(3-hydroxybutyrate) depolymerase